MNKLPDYLLKTYNNVQLNDYQETCILHKVIPSQNRDEEYYLSSHLIIFVNSGQKDIYSGDEHFSLSAGETGFIRKGLYILADIKRERAQFESLLFFLTDEIIDEFLISQQVAISGEKNYSPLYKIERDKNTNLFFDSMFQHMQDCQLYPPSFYKLKIFELLHLLSANKKNHNFTGFLNSLKNKTQKDLGLFMEHTYTMPLKVEDYATLSGRSLASFKRDFKKQYNQSPGMWIKARRLEKARELLSHSKKSVTEVCFEVGYENISHFIKSFKEYHGVTPRQYTVQKEQS